MCSYTAICWRGLSNKFTYYFPSTGLNWNLQVLSSTILLLIILQGLESILPRLCLRLSTLLIKKKVIKIIITLIWPHGILNELQSLEAQKKVLIYLQKPPLSSTCQHQEIFSRLQRHNGISCKCILALHSINKHLITVSLIYLNI